MSIIYVHGVNTRESEMSAGMTAMLRRYVAKSISDEPDQVPIEYAFWGDVAAKFAWEGASRPRTPIAGMGAVGGAPESWLTLTAAESGLFEGMPIESGGRAPSGGLAPAGPGSAAPRSPSLRLKDLSADELADLLAAVFTAEDPGGADPSTLMALDDVAHDPATQSALGGAEDVAQEWRALAAAVRSRLARRATVAGMGFDWLDGFGSRLKEALGRGAGAPAYVLGRAMAELRKPINELISVFLGDVFEYLKERGTATSPGAIQRRFLACLDEAARRKRDRGEPIVVLSHSMGGQVVYDAVTHFLPRHPDRRSTKIDFWCATASQVGLFEELKLFAAGDDSICKPGKVPFPAANLGYWWNVWDHNDFVSFTGHEIFDGIDDESYNSGMGLARAHGGYLKRPSFYRKLGEKVASAVGTTP